MAAEILGLTGKLLSELLIEHMKTLTVCIFVCLDLIYPHRAAEWQAFSRSSKCAYAVCMLCVTVHYSTVHSLSFVLSWVV